MKILLTAINSKYIHSNLAVFSLKAYHDEHTKEIGNERKKSSVEIAEYTINQYTNDILAGIFEKKPDVVAFSCYIWNISQVYEVAVELKKVLPETDIWLGGPEVTYDSEKVLREHPYIDGVMVGEGEETFLELCNLYEKKGCAKEVTDQDLMQIRQITFRDRSATDEIHKTQLRPLLDMDVLPFVYQDMEPFVNKIIYYESSRGCPYGCSYCLSSVEKSVRFRSLSKVLPELQIFLDRKVAQVKFVDRTFNCNHDRMMEILRYLLEHDNGITNFHFEIAADLLRDDEIALMSKLRPGLIQLEIGVQTSNPKTIHEIDRKMDLSVLTNVVTSIHEQNNVHQHLDLIAGLPYEGIDSFKRSFDYVYGLEPQQLQLGFLKVLKGSKMHRQAEEYEIVYQDKPPYEVLYTKWLSYEEVLALKNVEELVDDYYNSRQYVYTLEYLTNLTESPYGFFAAFADFYKKNGYFGIKHTRMTRYDLFHQFIGEYLQSINKMDCLETATELLIFDLYLRENVKTRPAFAKTQGKIEKPESEQKKELRLLYQQCGAPKTAHLEGLHATTVSVLKKMIDLNEKKIMDLDQIIDLAENNKVIWLLFDYETRDSLNYNASVFLLKK